MNFDIIKKFNELYIAKLLKVLIGILVFFGMVISSYNFLNERFLNEGVDRNIGFKVLPKDSMDVIVLGSSHAQYSFLPNLFNQETGLYSFVLGSPCQPYEVSYEMLKEALKTQNPELVILEGFTATPMSKDCSGDECYVMAGYLMTGEEKQNTYNYLSEEKAISYKNEFINNHNLWRGRPSFKSLVKKEYHDESEIDSVFGYRWNIPELPAWNHWYPMIYDEQVDVSLEQIDIDMLNNIKQLCDENNIKFMMYYVPVDGIDVENQSYRYKIWDWCNENGVLYQDQISMAPQMKYNMRIHNDGAHSYINGAALTTHYLTKFINEHYTFESHEENELLNKIYSESNGGTFTTMLESEYDPLIYGQFFKGYNGVSVIRYNKSSVPLNKELVGYLNDLGCEEGFENYKHYFAVIDNGEIVHTQDYEGDFEYKGNAISFKYWGMDLNGENVDWQSDLSLLIFSPSMDKFVYKSINYQRPKIWEFGYNYYGE